jgi:hypothetical protein
MCISPINTSIYYKRRSKMSSLQKFHRRTLVAVAAGKLVGSEAPVAGSGFYLGLAGDGTSYIYVAPKSTEVQRAWGSGGTTRSTTSTTNGVANTTTLFNFGSAAHPAAYHCRALTTGGYNTWYLPAKDELNTVYSNKSATPFATANSFVGNYYWTSTEGNEYGAWAQQMSNGNQNSGSYKGGSYSVRAVRRV